MAHDSLAVEAELREDLTRWLKNGYAAIVLCWSDGTPNAVLRVLPAEKQEDRNVMWRELGACKSQQPDGSRVVIYERDAALGRWYRAYDTHQARVDPSADPVLTRR